MRFCHSFLYSSCCLGRFLFEIILLSGEIFLSPTHPMGLLTPPDGQAHNPSGAGSQGAVSLLARGWEQAPEGL